MNCFYHPAEACVATCIDCGKGLCKQCASLYEAPICNECNERRFKKDKQSIMQTYIITALLFVAGFAIALKFFKPPSFVMALTFGYVFAGTLWGWKVIGFLTPNIFLFMSWIGWMIYYSVKIMLALFIGIVAMPVGIIRNILRHINTQSKGNNIKNNMKNSA